MGYFSERKGFNRDLRRNSSLSSMHDWSIRDLQFPVYCQELDDTEPSKLSILVCGALGILETRAPCVLSVSQQEITYTTVFRLNSEGTPCFTKSTPVTGGECAGLRLCLSCPKRHNENLLREMLSCFAVEMWDLSVLINNLTEREKGHGFQKLLVV